MCGRTIKTSGLVCQRPKDEHLPQACYSHLTRDERIERDRIAAQARTGREARYAALEPACWKWAVPTFEEMQEMFLRSFGPRREEARRRLSSYMKDPEELAIFIFRDWHSGCCAICGDRPATLVLDHDHRTGLMRGYLCHPCNLMESRRKGEPHGPFAKYRERNPATILNVDLIYTNGWGQTIIDPPARAPGWGRDNPLYGIGL
jgi:hypothetical protein